MLTVHQIIVLFLGLGCLLGLAHLLGALAQKFQQPAVLGELLAGVLLGPTILGNLWPELNQTLFPVAGPSAVALEAISTLGVVLFLLVAGLEVDLSTVWKHGTTGLKIGLASIAIPFAVGFGFAWAWPQGLGQQPNSNLLAFALFFAVALSISALPVIAKTLMDMDLYRSDLGVVIISAAIFNDLVGWVIFALLLTLLETGPAHGGGILGTIALTLGFTLIMLTLGRFVIHRTLFFVNQHTKWPSGVLGFALTLALLGAAFSEWIGIHSIFGAFFVGVAIGDSSNLSEHTRGIINHFISFFFAPLFFASIGLKVNFLAHFDLVLVVVVLLVACLCKIGGGMLGARWAGMPKREAWSVGYGLNSRGAMEIILALLALSAGLIHQSLFVALVVMAIVTSMISGPMMRRSLKLGSKRRFFFEALSKKRFQHSLEAKTPKAAIAELALLVTQAEGLHAEPIFETVWAREAAVSTGIGNRVALPHARLEGLKKPLIGVGLSPVGIDFDSPDGKPANLIFLVLTPMKDSGAHLEIISEIARLFRNPALMDRILRAEDFGEFFSLLKREADQIHQPQAAPAH